MKKLACLPVPGFDAITSGRLLQARLLRALRQPEGAGEHELRRCLVRLLGSLTETAVREDEEVLASAEEMQIDLVLKAPRLNAVLAIELKWNDRELPGQTAGYRAAISRRYPHRSSAFVFLTKAGDAPQDEGWTPVKVVPSEFPAPPMSEVEASRWLAASAPSRSLTAEEARRLPGEFGAAFPARLADALSRAAGEPFRVVQALNEAGRPKPSFNGGWAGTSPGRYLRLAPSRRAEDARFIVERCADRNFYLPFVMFELLAYTDSMKAKFFSCAQEQNERKRAFRSAVEHIRTGLLPLRARSVQFPIHEQQILDLEEDGADREELAELAILRSSAFVASVWPAYAAAIERDLLRS